MEPSVILVVIDGPIDRAAVPVLCARFVALLGDAAPGRVVCDVGALTAPDVTTVDALARLGLVARRRGLEVSFSRASPRLVELLGLTGLLGVLAVNGASRLEARGQPEERKEVGGVQEEGDPGDPIP
jgi:hypothetical protein